MSATDVRTQLALDIINKPNGVYKVYKTTRVGATTSLCISCLIQRIPFLILEPTNRIISETIIKDVKIISGRPNAKIIHIPSNFKCKLNEIKIEDNPDYGDFDFLPLATKCASTDKDGKIKDDGKCEHFDKCPVTEIRRAKKIHGICTTYDKLVAIIKTAEMFPDSFYNEILNKINKQIGVVILDEVHGLAYDKTSEVSLYGNHDAKFASAFIDKMKKANQPDENKFVILENVISNYQETISASVISDAVQQLNNQFLFRKLKNSEWIYLKHTRKVKNIKLKDFFCGKDKRNPNTGKMETIDVTQDNVTIEAVAELMDITAIRHEYNITMDEITAVFKILNIITNKELVVRARKISAEGKDDTVNFNVLAINYDFKKNITKFLQGMQFKKLKILGTEKDVETTVKVFLTSATVCSHDYNQYFLPNTKIDDIVFGGNGDPLKINDKHFLFCDTKSFTSMGDYSVYNRRFEIMESCVEIMDLHGAGNCIIFCRNIDEYDMFNDLFEERYSDEGEKPSVTYYRSSESIGVKSSYRVGIHIGLAHIPSDSHDLSCDTVGESRILAEEQMHCDTWQAASRAKDPSGKVPSISFFLGATKRDVENISSWGVDRRVEIIPPEKKGMKKEINVTIQGEKISSPNVVYVSDWGERLIMSMVCRYGLYSSSQKIECYECNNLMNNLAKDELSVSSKADLLRIIFSDGKTPLTRLKYSNGTFSENGKTLNEKRINQHLSGDARVYYHSSSGMTNYLMFESDSDVHIGKLKLFFDTNNIPYVIEKLDGKYRVWIFMKEVKLLNTKMFGLNILEYLNFKKSGKNMECTMCPETVRPKDKDSEEDLIQLPFGKYSQILYNGEFVDDVEMEIGIIDIMQNEIYKQFKVQGIGKTLSLLRTKQQS